MIVRKILLLYLFTVLVSSKTNSLTLRFEKSDTIYHLPILREYTPFTQPKFSPIKSDINFRELPYSRKPVKGTRRIVVLRVEFLEDTSSLTTGNGKFIKDTTAQLKNNDTIFTEPPHLKRYFELQMMAMKNYITSVSENNLNIEWEIYPEEESLSITLPHSMLYYSPPIRITLELLLDSALARKAVESVELGLARLFRDAITIADSFVDFTGVDDIIIFHAGADKQTDIKRNTPGDVYSATADIKVIQKYLANGDSTYPGISVDNGKNFVKQASIIPETVCQDNFVGSIFAVLVHEYMHQLGAVDLYNTVYGIPAVGDFSLMDQNSIGEPPGFVPPYLDAWHRIYFGWIDPVVLDVRNGEEYETYIVSASAKSKGTKAVVIPVNSHEYFLIENRNSLLYTKINEKGQYVLEPEILDGVPISYPNYDFWLPGSGLLIWHIDEWRIAGGGVENNEVNIYLPWRGVFIEEADGIPEIGNPSARYWTGNKYDLFYEPNNTEFGTKTIPASDNNSGAPTWINISSISKIDSIMNFKVSFNPELVNWQEDIGFSYTNSPSTGDINGDGINEIINVNLNGEISVFKPDGKYISSSSVIASVNDTVLSTPVVYDLNKDGFDDIIVSTISGKIVTIDGKTYDFLNKFNFEGESSIQASPSLQDVVDDERMELLFADAGGNIYLIDENGNELYNWSRKITEAIYTTPIVARHIKYGKVISVLASDGALYFFDANGNPLFNGILELWSSSKQFVNPVTADFDNDNNDEIVCVVNDSIYFINLDSIPEVVWRKGLKVNLTSSPAIGDIDADGELEIVILVSGEEYRLKNKEKPESPPYPVSSFIYAFKLNGALMDNFPVEIPYNFWIITGLLEPSPVLVDINKDDKQEIIACYIDRTYIYDYRGKMIKISPITSGEIINSTPAIAKWDNNLGLYIASSDGYLSGWQLPFSYYNSDWSQYGGNSRLTFSTVRISKISNLDYLIEKGYPYIYPAPVTGNIANLRMKIWKDLKWELIIYTISGNPVMEKKGELKKQSSDNDIMLDFTNFVSGLYIAKFKCESINGDRNEEREFLFAIIH